MASFSDYLFAVHSSDTARIQEAHILAGHMLCDWIELEWMNEQSAAKDSTQAPQMESIA
jgi:D-sedoheptulose 7-phosphate isomerase